MKNMQEKIKNLPKTLITKMVKQDADEWPPTCLLLAYQPTRPQDNKAEESK